MLVPGEAERQTEHHGDRPADHDQKGRDQHRRDQRRQKVRGGDQEAQHDEHDHLREPGETVMEAVDQLRRPMPPVAGNQAGEVDREKPLAPSACAPPKVNSAHAMARIG